MPAPRTLTELAHVIRAPWVTLWVGTPAQGGWGARGVLYARSRANAQTRPGSQGAGHAVLLTYDGDNHTRPDAFLAYHSSKEFTYRGPVTILFTGTQIDPKKNAGGTAFVQANVTGAVGIGGELAIAPGDPRTQTTRTTIRAADNQCKFGCVIGIVTPVNMRWHIVVTK